MPIVSGGAYVLGVADILSADPSMKTYPAIKTGFTYIKDPWLQSLWFDYSDYDGAATGVCWLGQGGSNSIWFQEG